MNKETDQITSLILNWQKTGDGWTELLTEVSCFVIEFPEKNRGWDCDKCSEFYLFFYPRMLKLIEKFEYRGMSFKAILKNTILWQMSSFRNRIQVKSNIKYCVRYDCMIQAESACDSAPVHELKITEEARQTLNFDDNGIIHNERLRRRLLMLTYKNAHYVDENHVNKIAEITGCECCTLFETLQQLRVTGELRRSRVDIYRKRENKAYIELCRLQREKEYCCDDAGRELIDKKIDTVQKRMRNASRGRKSVHLGPTNLEVAEVMGLPKGSIDSGLYMVKKLLSSLLQQDDV
ncbi:MAG: hypothetical protein PQJ61_02320 [Spirochaetales bacterium]|uniref:Uncharacterized protein n=1 Tax=Candidatus Thalassospirochaeta sargassi TaxID=3119039 RepID=A0AAJ1IAA3_9SPIO|nr:hypothetical protein [Spirochaetales bacterium]